MSAPDRTDARAPLSTWRTLRRALRLTPEFTAGRVVVPIAVQQTIDRGLRASGGPDLPLVRTAALVAALAVGVTALAAYAMNVRLYRSTESGLAALRVRTFRHVHDLSVLTQSAQRRGSLVSRVTSDIDQLSQFMQWGGILLVVSAGQLLLATVLMAVYSWPLALLVYACFVPLAIAVRGFQRRLAVRYGQVRERVGDMLGAVSESVVGAPVIRAYGVQARTSERIDTAIERHRSAATRAQVLVALTFSPGEVVAALVNAGVIVLGVVLGVGGGLTPGELVAFLFLVTLFVAPVQTGTEVLNEAQNALAGIRRVLDLLDTPTDVADPGPTGVDLPRGAAGVRFEHVS